MPNLTGQGIYQKSDKPKAKRKGVKPVSDKKAAYRRSGVGKLASLYIGLVKVLPCAVSGVSGPSDAHHCICGRFGSRKSSDFDVIPLSKAMHQDGPGAIHNGKASWVERHKPDTYYIAQTRFAVLQMADEKTRERLEQAFKEADKDD